MQPYAALQAGALLGLIAPAGPAKPGQVEAAQAMLMRLGYPSRVFPSCHAQGAYLAGDDSSRLADLHAAFADPAIAAIFCVRGGYGSGRLLDRIDIDLIRANPKPLIGYSDITALHALLVESAGLVGFHGPMPTSDMLTPEGEADGASMLSLLAGGLMTGRVFQPACQPGLPQQAGRCRGRLVGGNLSLVAALTGTPWAWRTEGNILFLEDIGEEPYRVDRLLMQLRLAGVLDAASGFLLGSFTEADDPAPVLAEYLLPLGKPVLSGWPSGHCTPNHVLPLGALCELDADLGCLTLCQDIVLPPAIPS